LTCELCKKHKAGPHCSVLILHFGKIMPNIMKSFVYCETVILPS